MHASAGGSEMLVSLDLYSAEDVGDLLDVERVDDQGRREAERVTREVLVVPVIAIAKVELLYEHPGQAPFGFQEPGAA
jgi:hypothetical protein